MDLSKFSTVPTTPREAKLLFVVAPPLFAVIAAATSVIYSYVTLSTEAFIKVEPEILAFTSWISASAAVGGVLFAWVQLLRYRSAGPPPSEEDRLKAALGVEAAAPPPTAPEVETDPVDE